MEIYLTAILRLHDYIIKRHWNGQAIEGPMPIDKLNWHITRYVKAYLVQNHTTFSGKSSDSYLKSKGRSLFCGEMWPSLFPNISCKLALGWIPWGDNYKYKQGQGYWIHSNLILGELLNDRQYQDYGRICAEYIIQEQLPSGAWKYPPLQERRNHIGSIEGAWASLALIKAYLNLGNQEYLEAVLKWDNFQINEIGIREYKDSFAINFLHEISKVKIPNATTLLLWLVTEIYKTTGDDKYLRFVDQMIRFLEYSQMENGEFQYIFNMRPHFQCFQYNSFEFMDLAHPYAINPDERIWRILKKSAEFLATGISTHGACCYNCFKEFPEVNYWTTALAAALKKAQELGLGDYRLESDRAYQRLLTQQRTDGSIGFSRRNYVFLSDQWSYPQQLVMILRCLLDKVINNSRSNMDVDRNAHNLQIYANKGPSK